jgi:outer membrane protein assembly factor BamA
MAMRTHSVVLIAFLVAIFFVTHTAAAQQEERELRIRSVDLRGNTALNAADIQQLVECVNQLPSGADKLRDISERLLRKYQDIGYYKAIVSDPEVQLKVQGLDRYSHFDVVDLVIRVQQGRMYRLSEVRVRGGTVFSATEYRSYLSLKPGDVFSRSAVFKGLERLKRAYCDVGYIDFTPVPDTYFDEQNGTIVLDIYIDEGKQFRWGALIVKGENSVPGARRRLLDSWKPHEGTICDCWRTLGPFLRQIGGRPDVKPEQVFSMSSNHDTRIVNVYIELSDPPTF